MWTKRINYAELIDICSSDDSSDVKPVTPKKRKPQPPLSGPSTERIEAQNMIEQKDVMQLKPCWHLVTKEKL